MADLNQPPPDLTSPSPKPQENETLAIMSLGNNQDPEAENGDPATGSANGESQRPGSSPTDAAETHSQKQVKEVLASEIGISTLLNRLKQSIASAKEFALFLKKRSVLEDDHAKGMKKLCRTTQDSIRHQDHRQGSFAKASEEMLSIHERMAENGVQFALSLHQMHEDLLEVGAVSEKHRKGWKQTGMEAENRLVSLETAMRKSKTKYDSLAEEYDRVRTGEAKQGPKVFGFKGPKSAAQHEEDLLRKVQAADTDYMGKVQAYQTEKATVESTTRPEAIKALEDLINECDAGTLLQMQKFGKQASFLLTQVGINHDAASFNEKLLLSNGLVISPLKAGELGGQHTRSLKDVIHAVDNKQDLQNYVVSFHGRVPLKSSEPKYERNPVLNPQQNVSMGQLPQPNQPQTRPSTQSNQQAPQTSPSQPMPPPPRSMGSQQGGFDSISSPSQGPGPQELGGPPQIPTYRPGSGFGHDRSFSHGALLNQQNPPSQPPYNNMRNSTQATSGQPRFDGSVGGGMSPSGPPQLGALPFQTQQPRTDPPALRNDPISPPYPGQQLEPAFRSVSPPSTVAGPTKSKQVFGIPLMRLYERDSLAVPMVVYQCIQAVDLYGLAVEGIYRLSGSQTHVQKLKSLFDTGSSAPPSFFLPTSSTPSPPPTPPPFKNHHHHHHQKNPSHYQRHLQKLTTKARRAARMVATMTMTDSESRILDFRNPENFFHDVNSVAGLLKQFLRDLPDPLLTGEHYGDFIEAAKHDDDIVRRDSLHAIINGMPDPNYATLRALMLHLHRVTDNSSVNRMNSQNIAIVFGPTLMGTAPGSNIADAGWQVRVVDTILQNTYQIFDED